MLNNRKVIEIRKAGFVNKGAELMLYAIFDKMRQAYPEAIFVMTPTGPTGSAPYSKIAKLGFFLKPSLWLHGIQFGDLAMILPKTLRQRYGLVLEKEIDIVIDAAGFAYSDQWGEDRCLELARSMKRWRKKNTKVILMPQAFGPYTSIKTRRAMSYVAKNANLIYARDSISYDHLIGVTEKLDNIHLCGDFTNLVSGIVPENFDPSKNNFCIVPNYRMIDKTPKEISEAYVPLLIKCTKYLLHKKLRPFILVHEGQEDLMLAKIISEETGDTPIVKEDDPLKIKGILGCSIGTIGSRFHGLVSALSQGVPSLATAWSHKYQMLLEDYGFPEGLIDITASDEKIFDKMDLLADGEQRKKIKSTIETRSKDLKMLSEKMWDEILVALQ